MKAAAAAGQARLTAALDTARRTRAASGVPAARRGRGVAAEVALARRDSPVRGGKPRPGPSLVHEMPHTLAALEQGALSGGGQPSSCGESACLDVEDRRRLDRGDLRRYRRAGWPGDAALAGRRPRRSPPAGSACGCGPRRQSENDRVVTIRPAPDTMTYIDRAAAGGSGCICLRRTQTGGRRLFRRPLAVR